MKSEITKGAGRELESRFLRGEGWYICVDCGARLASFDLKPGQGDLGQRCPTPNKCGSMRGLGL